MFNKLHPVAFLLSFAIGLFVSIYYSPTERVVRRYPVPDRDVENVTYRSAKTNRCYQYRYRPVKCEQKKTSPFPIVELRPEEFV